MSRRWTKEHMQKFKAAIAARRKSGVKRSKVVEDVVYVRMGNKLYKCRPISLPLYSPIDT